MLRLLKTKLYTKRVIRTITKHQYRYLEVSAMHCMQCEQTSHNTACTNQGICGKLPEVSNSQDLLLLLNQNIGKHVIKIGENNINNKIKEPLRKHILESSFSTLTNVNFSEDRIIKYISKSIEYRDILKKQSNINDDSIINNYQLPNNDEQLLNDAQRIAGLPILRKNLNNDDCFGLRECAHYGLKGVAAYFAHSEALRNENDSNKKIYDDKERDGVYQNIYQLLNGLTNYKENLGYYIDLCMKVGETNLKVMELLDKCHTNIFGHPIPTTVSDTPVPGPCILLSGHDILDVKKILDATQNTNINIYTHGELLPAHSYPKLQNYSNLKGHFGQAWQNQFKDFRYFPGPIIMTSNCLMPPRRSYRDRLYTTNAVGYDDIKHIDMNNSIDLRSIMEHSIDLNGFTKDDVSKFTNPKPYLTGFGHNTLLENAGEILNAINTGALKNIFVIGGCDGTEKVRSYFTELGKQTPNDSIILTMGCGKFRLRDLDLGNIGPFPRIIDCGQCNDSYSAVVVAIKLAEVLKCNVNDLPLHFAISWFEQKAVAVLLTLLHLGIKNIHLGPALPAFLTPNVKQYLNENLGLKQVNMNDASSDLKNMLR